MNRNRPSRGSNAGRNRSSNDNPRHPRGPQARGNNKPGKSQSSAKPKPGERKSTPNGAHEAKRTPEKKYYKPKRTQAENLASKSDVMRLNRFLSISGICSRRDADKHIEAGLVTVNGKVVTELGTKVKPTDEVRYNGTAIKAEAKVYLLLNKPKGFLTTMDDPRARKTVMELIGGACKERIYPVGRLDRATTGVLLFTNDGDMAKKLTHPSAGARKIYHVQLDKKFKKPDFDAMMKGLELEDGVMAPDALAYLDDEKRNLIGIEIHSGKNRIVRRMFEHLGYEVVKLDRTSFAGLTKKRLNRGQFRFLTKDEVNFLKTR